MSEPERYPLDDAAIALLADINAQVAALHQYWGGALALFLRQHELQGVWRPAKNGRELERETVETPQQV